MAETKREWGGRDAFQTQSLYNAGAIPMTGPLISPDHRIHLSQDRGAECSFPPAHNYYPPQLSESEFQGALDSVWDSPPYELESEKTIRGPVEMLPKDPRPDEEPDEERLSFYGEPGGYQIINSQGHIESLNMEAQLHGMFFVYPDSEPTPGKSISQELICYRRNLFRVFGTVAIPNCPINVLCENGSRALVSGLKIKLSATESIDGNFVRLVVVPWKSDSPDTAIKENENGPEVISLPLLSTDRESSLQTENIRAAQPKRNSNDPTKVFTYPIAFQRLQFRFATANNGRGKGLQQHFTLHLNVMATMKNGRTFSVCKKSSSPIVVRGRSSHNLQARREIPLITFKPTYQSDHDRMAALEEEVRARAVRIQDFQGGMKSSLEKTEISHSHLALSSRIFSGRWYGFLLFIMRGAQNSVRRLFRPKLSRHQRRITWICGCGVELYADFNTHQHEYMNELAAILHRPIAPPTSTNGSVEINSLQNAPSSSSSETTLPKPASPFRSNINSSQTPASSLSSISDNTIHGTTKKQYLELCINTGEYTKTLAEIDLLQIACDGDLFKRIRSEYTRLRSARSRFWLLKPSSVHFVRSKKTLSVGILRKPLAIPPDEVKANKYTYSPCPLEDDPPMPQDIFLHYLSCTAYNPKMAWLPRLPKKLDLSILRFTGAVNYGWGVHINEGPNYFALGLVNIGMMIASGIAAFLWKYFMHDFQGAFGFAGWIVAVLNGVLVAYIAKWQQV